MSLTGSETSTKWNLKVFSKVLINSMSQPAKGKRSLLLKTSSRPVKGELGSVVYRVASPTGVPDLGSQRFWQLANQGTQSLAKLTVNDALGDKLPPWKKASNELNHKIEEERRLQPYNTPYSFLTSVGGKNTSIGNSNHPIQQKQQKKTVQRVKSARVMPRREPVPIDQELIPTDHDNSELWPKQLSKYCPAVPKQPTQMLDSFRKEQNCLKPPSANPANRVWSALRPVTAKSTAKTFTRESLPVLQERINQAKVKQINDLMYHSPVQRIGINMQYLQLFTYQHLNKLKEGELTGKKFVPIQYAVRGISSVTVNAVDANTSVPVCLSLFPEYFDPNADKSCELREQYIGQLLKGMGGTYDPQHLIKLFHQHPLTQQDEYTLHARMQEVAPEQISPFNHAWVEHSMKDFDDDLIDQAVFRHCLREVWVAYDQSQRLAITTYRLLKPAERKRAGLAGPPPIKHFNNQDKIAKSGGYSKLLFTSWSSYVQESRRNLASSLLKYNPTNLALRSWFEDFSRVQLLELGLTGALALQGYFIDLETFAEMQEMHLRDREELLRHVWFRGALSIAVLGRYLHQGKNPWKELLQIETQDYRLVYHQQTTAFYKNRPAVVIYQELYKNYLRLEVPAAPTPPTTILTSILTDAPENAHQRPALSSYLQLLTSQLYEVINDNLSRFEQFIRSFVTEQAPLFKLNLSIRSDMLVYNHSQKDVVNILRQLLTKLLNITFQGADATISEQPKVTLLENSSRYMKYLPFVSVKQVPSRQLLRVSWFNTETFQQRVNELLAVLARCYDTSLTTIRVFETFQPLVRRPDLTFDFLSSDFDDEAYTYEAFLRHTDQLRFYQSKLNELDDGYNYPLFHVNVLPVKSYLTEKINEMLYLAQKKYKRILFRDIHLVEGTSNDLSQKLLSCNKTAEQLSSAESLLEVIKSTTLPNLRESCHTTIRIILSYIGTMGGSNTTSSVLSVLQAKLAYVYKLPRSIHELIEGIVEKKHQKERFTLESDLKETIGEAERSLRRLQQTIEGELMNYAYLHSKLAYYYECLNTFEQVLNELGSGLRQLAKDHYLLFKEDSDKILGLQAEFLGVEKIGNSLISFWRNAYKFDKHIRCINKLEVKELEYDEHQRIICECRAKADKLSAEMPPKSIYTKYLTQLKEELGPYERCRDLLRLLSSKLLTSNHYEWLPDPKWPLLPVRGLIDEMENLSEGQRGRALEQVKKVCESSAMQHQVRTILEQSAREISEIRLKTVPGPNDIEVVEWQDELERIGALRFQVRGASELMISRRSDHIGDVHLQKQLGQLLSSIDEIQTMTSKIKVIQQDYLAIEGLFHIRELRYLSENRERFRLIQQIWSDLMKELVLGGSFFEFADRKETMVHLNKASELLGEVRLNLTTSQSRLCQHNPRLYFVDKQLLFDVMCGYDEQLVRKALLSCFPDWQDVTIVDGRVTSVGVCWKLQLDPPVQVRERFSQVQLWLRELEAQVRKKLQLLLTSLLIESKQGDDWLMAQQYPEQIKALALWLNFTCLVEQHVRQDSIEQAQQAIQQKLSLKQLSRGLRVTLAIQLETIHQLQRRQVKSVQNEYWQQHPRVYHHHQLTFLQIGASEFQCGYEYIDSANFQLLDHQPFGRTLVATGSFGKVSRVVSLAQILAIQVRLLSPSDSYDQLDRLLRGCIQNHTWLVVPHIAKHPEQNIALLYHHINASKFERKTARGFEYFVTLSEDEMEGAQQSHMIKQLLRTDVVRIKRPPIPRMVRVEAELAHLQELGLSLQLFLQCLQHFQPELVDVRVLGALVKLFSQINANGTALKEMEHILHKVFRNRPQYDLVQACFMREFAQPATEVFPVKVGSRHQIVYGQAYCSAKTTRIRDNYGPDKVKVLYCQHMTQQQLEEALTLPEKVFVLDRGLSLYRTLKPTAKRLNVWLIFEQESIQDHDPSLLIECQLTHLLSLQAEPQLPETLSRYQSAVDTIAYRLKLKQEATAARSQFHLLLNRLLEEPECDPIHALLYALVWGYACYADPGVLSIAIKEEMQRYKEFQLLLQHDDLTKLTWEGSRLTNCRTPHPLYFGGQWRSIEVGSVVCSQLAYLSSLLNGGIFVTGAAFLTSHIRLQGSLYIGCSSHTTTKSFFSQFAAVCLQKTAKPKQYTAEWQTHHRIVVDDVHLANSQVVSCLTQALSEHTMALFMQSPLLPEKWLLAAKPTGYGGCSDSLRRIRCRLFNVAIPQEQTHSVYTALCTTVLGQKGQSILSAAKQIESYCYRNGQGWLKCTPNKLLSPLCLQNLTDGIPIQLRPNICALVPECLQSKTLGNTQETLNLKENIQLRLTPEDEESQLQHVVVHEMLQSQVRSIYAHLSKKQNILLIGSRCTGKAYATRLACLLLNKHLEEEGGSREGAAGMVRLISEQGMNHEAMQYRLKNLKSPPWLLGEPEKGRSQPQWVVCLSSLQGYEHWTAWAIPILFEHPPTSVLQKLCMLSLPAYLQNASMGKVLTDLNTSLTLRSAMTFNQLFKRYWTTKCEKAALVRQNSLVCKERIECFSPGMTAKLEQEVEHLNQTTKLLSEQLEKHQNNLPRITALHASLRQRLFQLIEDKQLQDKEHLQQRESNSQQQSALESRFAKNEAKLVQSELKAVSKPYSEYAQRLLKKPFENTSQLKPLLKSQLPADEVAALQLFLEDKSRQQKLVGPTKALHELLSIVLELQLLMQRAEEIKVQASQQPTLEEEHKTALADTAAEISAAEHALASVLESINSAKEEIAQTSKMQQERQVRLERSKELWRQFTRLNFEQQLYEEAENIQGSIADTLLGCCLLVGADEILARDKLSHLGLDVSTGFTLTSWLYGNNCEKRVLKKSNLEHSILNKLVLAAHCPGAVILRDQAMVASRMQEIMDMLKQGGFDIMEAPPTVEQAVKYIRNQARRDWRFEQRRIIIIQDGELLKDESLTHIIKEYDDQGKLKIIYLSDTGAVPNRLEPYFTEVVVRESQKDAEQDIQRCLLSNREPVHSSNMSSLRQSILELQEATEARTTQLLTYLRNPSISLVELQDIYTIVFGLVDDLVSCRTSILQNSQKLRTLQEQMASKYAKANRICFLVYRSYEFLELLQPEFQMSCWREILSESVKVAKRTDSAEEFAKQLQQQLIEKLLCHVKHLTSQRSRVLLLSYYRLATEGVPSSTLEQNLIETVNTTELQSQLNIKHRKLLGSLKKYIAQQELNQLQGMLAHADNQQPIIAFQLPYDKLQPVVEMHSSSSEFVFYSPHQQPEESERVLRNALRRGQELFVFNAHLHIEFLAQLSRLLRRFHCDLHKRFRVWLTFSPQDNNFLPHGCLTFVDGTTPQPESAMPPIKLLRAKSAKRAACRHSICINTLGNPSGFVLNWMVAYSLKSKIPLSKLVVDVRIPSPGLVQSGALNRQSQLLLELPEGRTINNLSPQGPILLDLNVSSKSCLQPQWMSLLRQLAHK